MIVPAVSIVLPVCGPAPGIGDVVAHYLATLTVDLGAPFELIVIEASTVSLALPTHPSLRRIRIGESSWSTAVCRGLAEARGEILGYTNGGVDAEVLLVILRRALANPSVVVRVNRRTRSSSLRKLGSLAYNGACRSLFGLSCWDVNGTPKVFSRTHHPALLSLPESNLIDLAFTVRCQQEGYAVIEYPTHTNDVRNEGALGVRDVAALFWGAWRMARRTT